MSKWTKVSMEAKHLLMDLLTHRRLDFDPFSVVVRKLNRKLDDEVEVGLLET